MSLYCRALSIGVLVGVVLRLTRNDDSPAASATLRPSFTHNDGRRPRSVLGGAPRASTAFAPSHDASELQQQQQQQQQPRSAYHSVGKLQSLPILDLAQPGAMRQAARTRSYKKEIIIFESDKSMAGWAFYWVNQMRRKGYEHWLILADKDESCSSIRSQWEPMMTKHGEEPISCAWSSYPRTHPGWAQWQPRKGEDNMHNVYILWSTRWWVALQLLREDVNVLSLDVDAVLLTDIYALLRSPPLSAQDVIITRNTDASQSLNCGFVYFNRDGSPDGAPKELEGSGCPEQHVDAGAPSVPAAEWVCELMWERTRLFLEVDAASLTKKPAREVLWEQDAWNDLAKSLELRRRVFPWAVGYGKKSDIWAKLGYEREVRGGLKHLEKWVDWRHLQAPGLPPWPAPSEANAETFFKKDVRRPLQWLPVCAPPNVSSRASAVVPPQTKRGLPLGIVSRLPMRSGRLMIAPTWLTSLGVDPEVDWAGASPPAFAYLHLTNMWHCFPHMCWSKAGRLFWLRAHGFWDRRLDATGLTPRGVPYDAGTRVLALPAATFAHIGAMAPAAGASSRVRSLAFRRAHALVHNLVLIASLLGRRPVIPQVPCDFIRAVQPPRGVPSDRSRFGISHPSVVVTGTATAPQCHLTPGTWRPGAPDQCYHSWAMAQFDFSDFLASPSVKGAPNASLPVAPPHGDRASRLAAIGALCRQGVQQSDTLVMLLDSLTLSPLSSGLLDAPISSEEFKTEKERIANDDTRWRSVLQKAELRKLAASCPGAAQVISVRKTCVGYFLAE